MTNDIPAPAAKAEPTATLATIDQALLRDVKVEVEASLGRATLSVDELMALKAGSVVTLETGLADHVDIILNGARIARGEIVAVGDHFGVRLVELAAAK